MWKLHVVQFPVLNMFFDYKLHLQNTQALIDLFTRISRNYTATTTFPNDILLTDEFIDDFF